jgi:RNA polymerase sporulation-specific sigma factor
MMPADDRQLVSQAQAGDPAAMETLLNRFKGLVRARASDFFMAGADHEDVIQEGMIGLFKAIRTYQPDYQVPFSSFAAYCVLAQITDAVRRASRLKHGPLNESVSLQSLMNTEGETGLNLLDVFIDVSRADPEQAVLAKEALQSLTTFLQNDLSALEYKVVLLFMEGCSYQEMASRMEISTKSVDNALRRARQKFEQYYRRRLVS